METTTLLSGIVTSDALMGVKDELLAVVAVCVPVMITFIGLRKGISFMKSTLKSA